MSTTIILHMYSIVPAHLHVYEWLCPMNFKTKNYLAQGTPFLTQLIVTIYMYMYMYVVCSQDMAWLIC